MNYTIELFYVKDVLMSQECHPENDPKIAHIMQNLAELAKMYSVKKGSVEHETQGRFVKRRLLKRITFTSDNMEKAWNFANAIRSPSTNGKGLADRVRLAW